MYSIIHSKNEFSDPNLFFDSNFLNQYSVLNNVKDRFQGFLNYDDWFEFSIKKTLYDDKIYLFFSPDLRIDKLNFLLFLEKCFDYKNFTITKLSLESNYQILNSFWYIDEHCWNASLNLFEKNSEFRLEKLEFLYNGYDFSYYFSNTPVKYTKKSGLLNFTKNIIVYLTSDLKEFDNSLHTVIKFKKEIVGEASNKQRFIIQLLESWLGKYMNRMTLENNPIVCLFKDDILLNFSFGFGDTDLLINNIKEKL